MLVLAELAFLFFASISFFFSFAWYITSGVAGLLWTFLCFTLQNLWDFSWVFFPFVFSSLSPLFSYLPSVATWICDASLELGWVLGRVLGKVMVFVWFGLLALTDLLMEVLFMVGPWLWIQFSTLTFSHLLIGSFSLIIGYFSGSKSLHLRLPPLPKFPSFVSPPQSQKGVPPSSNNTPTYPICAVCYDLEVSTLFLPCAHIVCCEKCSKFFQEGECPICRVQIQKVQPVYFA